MKLILRSAVLSVVVLAGCGQPEELALPEVSVQMQGVDPTESDNPAEPFTIYQRIVGLAGKCIDVANGADHDGAKVQLFTCNGTNAQRWQLQTSGVVKTFHGRCLDVPSGNTVDGIQLQVYTCNGTLSQQFAPSGMLFRELKHIPSGKCVDVRGASQGDGTPIQLHTCNETDAQKWAYPIELVRLP